MAVSRSHWLSWLIAAVVFVGLAIALWVGGMWYAHQRMKMDMPGMEMGHEGMGTGPNGDSSAISGYAEVTVPSDVQQRIGVTVGEVEKASLDMSIRTVGIVQPDETRTARLHLKLEGWVEELFVNFTGQSVQKGDPLLAIYSPDFWSTQQEYLISRRAKGAESFVSSQQSLAEAVRRRMRFWDVPEEEIEQLEKTGTLRKNLTLRSPLTGVVLVKNAFPGQRVTLGDELYVVADLTTVWVQAKIYEYELPHIARGGPAKITFPSIPDREFTGKIDFIDPTVEEATRTVRVRIELPNDDGLLKPGLFAHIEISHGMGEGLLMPASAVLRTGERDIVFRADEDDRFVPIEVKLDTVTFGDRIRVLEGLNEGDRVLTSANFLIDSESRLRAGGGGMAGMAGMDMGGMEMGDMKGMKGMKTDKKGQSKSHGGKTENRNSKPGRRQHMPHNMQEEMP